MIGKVYVGKTFGCISYCLEDKKGLSEEQKEMLSRRDNVQHKDRAEVLYYNQCGGEKDELINDFKEVVRLSTRVEKPAFHFILRLAPGETLPKDKLMEMSQECAKEFGVADNQYLCILHKDTKEQHIHIIANRVGFNGKAAKDNNNYRRMAALCRRLEKQYGLQEVLSPRAFLSGKDRLLPRSDKRREQLKSDIRQVLEKSGTYFEFERGMQGLGYSVIKGRGISFIDDKKVKTKGSEVGCSLATLEKVFALKQKLYQERLKERVTGTTNRTQYTDHSPTSIQGMLPSAKQQNVTCSSTADHLEREIFSVFGQMFGPAKYNDEADPSFDDNFWRKKRKRKIS